MTGHQRSYAALELEDEAHGTPCPLEPCDGHHNPQNACTNVLTGDPMTVPHWQRLRAARQDDQETAVRPPSGHQE